MRIEHLIAGKAAPSRAYFETVNPATQEVLAEVAAGGAEEVNAAVAAAKAAFPKWAALAAPERAKMMVRLGDLVARQVAEIAAIESRDTGQVIAQTAKQLIPRAADNFYYFAEMCTRVDGHTYPTPTHLNYTLFHPVGVCALISPWNVPFMTGTWKIAPALAFGNTAVLKMSELSPMSIARLGELSVEAGLPPGVLNIVHGTGAEVGEPLCRHPDVRAISFTGSTVTGERIVRGAGLKKFSMELGGKSPFVVFEDAAFERALDAAVFMIFSNNGERCTAGSRILVQRSIYAEFARRFAERAARITVGDPMHEATIVDPMISPAHLAKVRGYIALGPREGATLLTGGLDAPDLAAPLRQGNFVRPTVFADVNNNMRIAQEEIFGPVACLIPFDDEADAVRQANHSAYGLSSYVWTENLGRAHRVRRPSRPACASSTARMCATCASPLAAPRRRAPGAKAAPGATKSFWSPRMCACRWGRTRFRAGAGCDAAPGRATRPPALAVRGGRSEKTMSLYNVQKFLYHLNRDPRVQRRYKDDVDGLLQEYALNDEERTAIASGDIGKLYVLGANGQLLMHFAPLLGLPWADYLEAMREGVRRHGPVRAGIYAMTTSTDEKVAGV